MSRIAGIFAFYKKTKLDDSLLYKIRKYALKIKHRGNSRYIHEDFPIEIIIYQKRHSKSKLPLNIALDDEKKSMIIIDGQIYNLKEIATKYGTREISFDKNEKILVSIIDGYKKYGVKIFKELQGSFSGVLYDGKNLIGFKDPIGAKPLYFCENEEIFIFASELKAVAPLRLKVNPINPGSVKYALGQVKNYYNFTKNINKPKLSNFDSREYAEKLKQAVKLSVSDNVARGEKICGLLSGGLDSTIITHIAKDLVEDLNVYTVGTKASKDISYAKKYTNLFDIAHTILDISLQDMLESLPKVIYALETFDAALIRSSVPMFLVSNKIKHDHGECILLTGEGGDELFGGYSYLLDYYSYDALNQELINLLEIEHKTGLQRVDRIPYYFSIEARAPLFDRRIVELALRIPPKFKIFRKKKLGVAKKWILRKAFENEMPSEFIWRKKQKFSNGAGSEFLLRDHINSIISNSEFEDEKKITENFTLRSKEELYYWRIFKSLFNPTRETISELGITNTFDI
ncbi:MAG: hypothetical protein EU552_01110 [Promethearchaeota archaeon]|nr:MAG: hypothetical protein EU552_01110 [Candidatus Lokiarchaeota archaeon]